MADALAEHLRRYNAAFGAQLTIADLHGRSLEAHVPAAHREATEALLDASFFRDLAVMADCQDVIRDLAERHDVFVVTAAMDVPVSFDAKYQWLQEHFPFIPPSRFVFCGDKGLIDADYLIDDRSRHFDEVQGAAAAVLRAAQRRGDAVSAGRIVGGNSRAVREGGRRRRRRARRAARLALAPAAGTQPVSSTRLSGSRPRSRARAARRALR